MSSRITPEMKEGMTPEVRKLVESGERWESAGNQISNAGKAMSGCGCFLTVFVTIPILVFCFILFGF